MLRYKVGGGGTPALLFIFNWADKKRAVFKNCRSKRATQLAGHFVETL